jgi:hypothetical protein
MLGTFSPIRIIALFSGMLFLSVAAGAQYYMGIATGNYGGSAAMYLNPANLANSKNHISIDILSLNAGVDNNLASINSGQTMRLFFSSDSLNLHNLFSFSHQEHFSLLLPYAEVRGPGISVSVGKNTFALSSRVRGFNQFHHFNQSLYRTIVDQAFRDETQNYDLVASRFNWTANIWSEIGLSYGRVLYQSEQHKLSAGLTLRYLSGITYISMKSSNLDAHYNQSADELTVSSSDLTFSTNILSAADQLANDGSFNTGFSNGIFGNNHGLSADVGAVYEYTASGTEGYTLRASVAFTDMGSINYKNGNGQVVLTGNGTMAAGEIKDSVQDFESLKQYAANHGFTADSSGAATKVYLPAAMIIGVDYHVWKPVYVNATFIGNVANRMHMGNSLYNKLVVTPRFETRLFSVALPFTYNTLSKSMKIGIGARLTGFFVGSDDLGALLSPNAYGVNFYFGGYVPLGKK